MKRFRPCLSLVVLIVTLPIACGRQPEPIRIGLLCPLSGEIVRDGRMNLSGAELAVDEVNRAGGLLVDGRRRQVALVVEDTGNSAETSVYSAQKLINRERVAALVGPFSSSAAIPVAVLAEGARIPMISPSASNPAVTRDKRWVFRLAFVDDFQGRLMARFARDDLGAEKAAVLYEVTDAYSAGIAEIFRRDFEASGGEIAGFESYVAEERDFTRHLERIAAGRAEVLFLPNFGDVVAQQARQARQAGVTATFLGSDSWNDSALAEVPELEGAFKSDHWHPDAADDRGRAFVDAYRRVHGPAAEVTRSAALAYDALRLLFHVIEGRSSVGSAVIRDGIAQVAGFHGVTGTISFQGHGDPERSAVILRIRDGRARLYRQVHPAAYGADSGL